MPTSFFNTCNFYPHLKKIISFIGIIFQRRCQRQSAISRRHPEHHILEKEVGDILFVRDNRSVSITKAGLLLKKQARDTVKPWQHFQEKAAGDRGELHGEISIFCSVTASYGILQNMLNSFRKLHPQVPIKLQTGDPARTIRMVQNSKADISIAAMPDHLPDNLYFKTAAITQLIFIAPKGFR